MCIPPSPWPLDNGAEAPPGTRWKCPARAPESPQVRRRSLAGGEVSCASEAAVWRASTPAPGAKRKASGNASANDLLLIA
jgi:hypothetical protein